MRHFVCLAILFQLAGCTTRGTIRPGELECGWPEHAARPLDLRNPADRRHLRDDAIAAEDFSIGHADSRVGRRTEGIADGYHRRREACMASVFSILSARHGVDVDVVAEYRLRRNRIADAVVMGSFGVLYLGVVYFLAGLILRRFSAEPVAAVAATVAVSVALGWAGTMLGEVWSILMETARLGRGHLSYRVARIPWVQHRTALFVVCMIAFWAIAAVRYRSPGRELFNS